MQGKSNKDSKGQRGKDRESKLTKCLWCKDKAARTGMDKEAKAGKAD